MTSMQTPVSARSSLTDHTITTLSDTETGEMEQQGTLKPGMKMHIDSVPALRMSRLSVMGGEDILKSVRDILTSARVDVHTARTARESIVSTPKEESVQFWKRRAAELETELAFMEGRVTECSEKGLELVDRVIDLEEQLEDQAEQHHMDTQDLRDKIVELESSKNHYKATNMYISEEFHIKESILRETQELEAEKETKADQILQHAKWVETEALKHIKEAKQMIENIPGIEGTEQEDRHSIVGEEGLQRSMLVGGFSSRCMSDAAYLYRVLQKYDVQFKEICKLPTRRRTLAGHSFNGVIPPECLVIKQSSYLRIWRLRVMKITVDDQPRLDFFEPSGRKRLRATMPLAALANLDLGTAIPKPGFTLEISGSGRVIEVTERKWQHGMRLGDGKNKVLFLTLKDLSAVEEWVGFFQQFLG
eukprot:TRINITY_DN3318_c2_g2_i1.p1 TRINITY_DN3318_c2_g2~~TRINITY_DN3318_c2_g2_i1.p1  ORF type:complete len:446 (+),score=68.98 TRINITY_DN3318_c2_g2_i1:81-1340(+)